MLLSSMMTSIGVLGDNSTMTIPTVASFSRSSSILKNLSGNTGETIILYRPGTLSAIDASTQLRYTGIVLDLRVKVMIRSLPESVTPELNLSDSDAERFRKVRDAEWSSPRFELWIYYRSETLTDWQHVASLSLVNQNPFYSINILPWLTNNPELLIAPDLMIGASIKATGSGYPSSEKDSIIIFGSVKEELDVLPSDSGIPTQSTNHRFIITSQPREILSHNSARKGAVFVNQSEKTVYLSLGNPSLSIGEGIALMGGGGSYEINYSNLYQGAIFAVSDLESQETISISGNEST